MCVVCVCVRVCAHVVYRHLLFVRSAILLVEGYYSDQFGVVMCALYCLLMEGTKDQQSEDGTAKDSDENSRG